MEGKKATLKVTLESQDYSGPVVMHLSDWRATLVETTLREALLADLRAKTLHRQPSSTATHQGQTHQ